MSTSRRQTVLSESVGRPRKRGLNESTSLGFKVDPELLRALDAEAERMSALQPPGRAKVSRTEVIKVVLYEWLAKKRAK